MVLQSARPRLRRIECDAGVSAKTLEREGVAAVMEDLERGRVHGLVVIKLDRLTRSLSDWDYLIKRYFSEEGGRRLFSVGDSIDTRTAAGRMVLNLLMTVAQWEREVIAERTARRVAREDRPRRAMREGALGYRLAPDGKTLVPDPDQQKAIAFMKQWEAQGKTYRDMSRPSRRWASTRRSPAASGAPAWSTRSSPGPFPEPPLRGAEP